MALRPPECDRRKRSAGGRHRISRPRRRAPRCGRPGAAGRGRGTEVSRRPGRSWRGPCSPPAESLPAGAAAGMRPCAGAAGRSRAARRPDVAAARPWGAAAVGAGAGPGSGVESPRKRHDPRRVAGVLLAGWLRPERGPESRAGAGVAAVESGLGAGGGLRLSTTLRGFLTTTMRRRSVSARAPSAPGRSADAVGCAALGGSGLRLMRVALGLRRSSESWRSGVAVGLSSLMLSYAGRSIRESTSPCQSTAGTSVC